MLSSAGGSSPALHADRKKASDDRPSCLENPRPEGAESTLTENVASPFQAEPRQHKLLTILSAALNPFEGQPQCLRTNRCTPSLGRSRFRKGDKLVPGAKTDT